MGSVFAGWHTGFALLNTPAMCCTEHLVNMACAERAMLHKIAYMQATRCRAVSIFYGQSFLIETSLAATLSLVLACSLTLTPSRFGAFAITPARLQGTPRGSLELGDAMSGAVGVRGGDTSVAGMPAYTLDYAGNYRSNSHVQYQMQAEGEVLCTEC